jgi:hypothetical protein
MAIRKNSTKKVVQDIVPSQKRSIRNITIKHEEEVEVKPQRRRVVEEPEVFENVEPIFTKKPKAKKTVSKTRYLITFGIILVSIAVIAIALSLSYSKATVTITPKTADFDISGTFTAKKGNTVASTDMQYESITVSDTLVETMPATKGPLIQTKAKGTVVIYNNHSATAQTLVAGTRISTPEGLIYRTTTTVSVPGKKTTPGSISVAVVADQVGEKYNINVADLKGDFKLPGYKGTTKYDTFYARIKTNITGGFSGNKMVIDETQKKAKIVAMQDLLKEQLVTKLNENVPKDYILYDTAYNIEYETPEPVFKDATNAEITVKGTAYGAIFKSNSLVKYIASKEIKKFPSDTYDISGDKELAFKISNIKDFSIKKGTPMIFTLKGPVTITGTFNEAKLKEELRGLKVQDSSAVFAKYTAIANAYTLITPFWMRSFPDSVEKILIEYKH